MASVHKHRQSGKPAPTVIVLLAEAKARKEQELGRALMRHGVKNLAELQRLVQLAEHGRTIEDVKKLTGVDLSQLHLLVRLGEDKSLASLVGSISTESGDRCEGALVVRAGSTHQSGPKTPVKASKLGGSVAARAK